MVELAVNLAYSSGLEISQHKMHHFTFFFHNTTKIITFGLCAYLLQTSLWKMPCLSVALLMSNGLKNQRGENTRCSFSLNSVKKIRMSVYKHLSRIHTDQLKTLYNHTSCFNSYWVLNVGRVRISRRLKDINLYCNVLYSVKQKIKNTERKTGPTYVSLQSF